MTISIKAEISPTVRVLYLVPQDREVRSEYLAAIEHAVKHLQIWYRNELGTGKTVTLDTLVPVVEVFPTPHIASFYATNPLGDFRNRFFNNVLHDGFELTGGHFNDPNNIWIFYIDADYACEQIGGAGGDGVAVLPANDLRGLTGQQNRPVCTTDPVDTAGISRWIGGLGHELGHAVGLPHPPACDAGHPSCPANALMWLGFRSYPETFLLPEDKATLDQSPFFSP